MFLPLQRKSTGFQLDTIVKTTASQAQSITMIRKSGCTSSPPSESTGLKMAANVETMMYVREKPWHGLGVEVSEAPNSEDALRFAGLDWNVRQENVFNSRGGVSWMNTTYQCG